MTSLVWPSGLLHPVQRRYLAEDLVRRRRSDERRRYAAPQRPAKIDENDADAGVGPSRAAIASELARVEGFARRAKGRISIDWIVNDRARAIVKRILRKYGYPPDKQDTATTAVRPQAERSDSWANG